MHYENIFNWRFRYKIYHCYYKFTRAKYIFTVIDLHMVGHISIRKKNMFLDFQIVYKKDIGLK